MRYILDESFLTGCDLIDKQHGQLFDAINALIEACEQKKENKELIKSLDFLNRYTINHFFDEEQFLKKFGYSDFYNHHQYHETFTKKIRDFSKQYAKEGSSDDMIEKIKKLIGSWLVDHIKGQDFRWARELKEKDPGFQNACSGSAESGSSKILQQITRRYQEPFEKRSSRKISIAVKITCLSSLLLVIAVLVMTVLGVYYMRNFALATALTEVEYRLSSNMAVFKNRISGAYGALNMVNGQLVDSGGNTLDGHYEVIDRLSRDLDITATIFVRDSSGFRRLVTTLRDEDGKRLDGTRLLTTNVALQPLLNGQPYMGEPIMLMGIPFIGCYEPVFSPAGRELIGALFVGVEVSTVHRIINEGSSRLILAMILIAVGLLAVSLALNIGALRVWILSPMKKIVSALHKAEAGEISSQLQLPPGDEMG